MINKYRYINNSFKKKLTYHLGSEAGFFSEYNNMILAMLYCLEHRIKFELYSADANFGFEKGWKDYFIPFCEESTNLNHSKYNYRQPIRNLSIFNSIKTNLFRLITSTDYLTYNLWDKFHNKNFEKRYINLIELNLEGGVRELSSIFIKLTWRYNAETQIEVDKITNLIKLPPSYIGMHIRGGDKFIEYKQIEIKKYFDVANRVSNLRDVFVLTDDYRIIEEIKRLYPHWNLYTLCDKEERGYFHEDFSNSDAENKRSRLFKLFASVDLLSRSDCFVGTYSSNPGMFLGMRMERSRTHGVDIDDWTIW